MNASEIQRIGLLVALGICAYLLIQAWANDYSQNGSPPEGARAPMVGQPATSGDGDGGRTLETPDFAAAANDQDAPGLADTANDVPDESLIGDSPEQASVLDVPSSSEDRLVRVRTPTLHVWIDRLGGDIVGLHLPKYPVSLDRPDVPMTLLDQSPSRTYVAQSGLMGADGIDAKSRPLYKTERSVYEIEAGVLDVPLRYVNGGVEVTKHFRFSADSYLMEVAFEIENGTDRPFTSALFAQLKRDGGEVEASSGLQLGPRPFLGAALTTAETRYEKLDFDDLDETPYRERVNGGWIAILQHYFLSAWIADSQEENRYFGERRRDGLYMVGFVGPTVTLPARQSGTISARFYAGPKKQKILEEIAPNLNLTVDYGFLWWLAVPLFYVLDWLQSYVTNWGVAIILLTLLIKLTLYPLSAASYRSMAKMRKVTPQLKRLQERYSDDRQKLSQEMMGLYKKEGANPLGGCLPLLLQMPVFISLYWVLYESVELRQAPFFGWIHDLAAMDPFFVLPILMGISMYLMQMLNPPMPDPMQAKMMKMMPIMFTVLFLFFPAGLVLYWLVNNVLSFAQQWFITRQIEAAGASK